MVQMAMNSPSSLGFTALRSRIMEGTLRVVTAIIKLRMVPKSAPLARRASATGMVPKMSAYMGTPTITARSTPRGFRLPRIFSIQLSGIQLWITAPMPTPMRM